LRRLTTDFMLARDNVLVGDDPAKVAFERRC
jgi:hypothetical protein